MAFQITSPLDTRKALLPHSLVMHVNPSSFSESFTKKIERIQTRGGFVEQHYGDEMTTLSAEGVSGAFLNIYTGTASVVRQMTIAWDRYRDLLDLFRNNGSVYDPFGNIVLQGRVMLQYDRGTYLGYFKAFNTSEEDTAPFLFKLDWTFTVQETILQIPISQNQQSVSPNFQAGNVSRVTRQPNAANTSQTTPLGNTGLASNTSGNNLDLISEPG